MIFKDKNILVIGDSILDETIVGRAVGCSLESPTMKLEESARDVSFGGAANVVENILALGGSCKCITHIGRDEYSHYFESWLDQNRPNLWLSSLTMDRFNNVKTRIWATKEDERYKYLQINRTDDTVVPFRIPTINPHMEGMDAVVLVDDGLGMFGEVNFIIKVEISEGAPVIASSQMSDRENRYHLFEKADYLCMNFSESQEYDKSFHGCITHGVQGCTFQDSKHKGTHTGFKVKSVDPCGAGDAFLAAFSLCVPQVDADALAFCNAWAALSTTKLGTTPPKIGELDELLGSSFCQ